MDNLENSCEPMDVDISNSTPMEISYTDGEAERSPINIKKIDIHPTVIINNLNKENKKKYERNKALFHEKYKILSIIILAISLISYSLFSIECYDDVDFLTLTKSLHKKVYGQSQAIDSITDFLKQNDQLSKTLIIYGGTGVGKTYTVSLLFGNMKNYSNIYHYTMSSMRNRFLSESMFGLTLCKSAVVIIDDITLHDKEIILYIKEILKKSLNLGKSVTLILIYNCIKTNQHFSFHCPDDFLVTLQTQYSDIVSKKKFVQFQTLTEDSLKKCIEHGFGSKMLDDYHYNNIMKNFNVLRDGCKGVHQKMKYLSEDRYSSAALNQRELPPFI